MKQILKSFAFAALALLAFSCGGDEPEVVTKPSLSIETKSIDFDFDGGSSTITFTANMDWTITSDSQWLQLSPKSGSGSTSAQNVTVTAIANDEYLVRNATVSISVGNISKNVLVSQAAKEDVLGFHTLTIKEFRNKKTDKNTFYRLVAEVASIANYQYGNLYLVDDTGYLYVYGLTATKVAENDQSFASLGIKPGDKISIVGYRNDYQGTIEASGSYLERVTPGKYNGWKASSTKAGWMELPATSDDDGHDIVAHMFHSDGLRGRSYSIYWDYENRVSLWEAYPLYFKARGSGSRSDAWALNPLIPEDKQFNVSKNSFRIGNGGSYIRGHQVPSFDRLNYKDNLDVFFCTNIFPQNSELNEGLWGDLEENVRTWSNGCDTLYVVTGVDVQGSTTYVLDNNDAHVTVPKGAYKALLRYSKKEGYSGVAFYMENKKPATGATVSSSAMSIADLEKKVGVDFFVNLPAAVGDAEAADIEKADPSTLSWL